MRYIFYADVYFIQNFMMKLAVLYLALYCNKIQSSIKSYKGIGKICLASMIGTLFEIVGLFVSGSYIVFVLGVHLFEIPCIVKFLLDKKEKKMLRVIASSYFFMLIINGVLEALWNQFQEEGSYMFCLLISCGFVIVGTRIWRNNRQMLKGIFQVKLLQKDRLIHTNGFYDSGNRLIDPYTGKGVHIISAKLWERMENTTVEPVYVPYQALGNEEGILEVYYIDEVNIEGEKGRKIIQKCPVGVTKDNLFEGKRYEIILNEEVF